jgi:hypothetical protein
MAALWPVVPILRQTHRVLRVMEGGVESVVSAAATTGRTEIVTATTDRAESVKAITGRAASRMKEAGAVVTTVPPKDRSRILP